MADDLLSKTLKFAEKAGATETIARLSEGPQYQIRFSNNNIDINKHWDHCLLEIFIATGRKCTEIDINNPTIETIEQRIKRATAFLKNTPDNKLYGGITQSANDYKQIPKIYDKRISDFYEKAPELVNVAINAAREEGAKRSAGVVYFGESNTKLMTSNNIEASYQDSFYRLTIRSFIDFESSGQGLAVGRDHTDIEKKFRNAGKEAGKIANMATGGKQGKAGTYDLIMSPTVSADILDQLMTRANPLLLLLNMSPLKDRFGEKITPEELTVIDDPHIAEGLASKPFDAEGMATEKTPIVRKGVLAGLIHNTSTAKIMQAKSTGNSEFVDFGTGSKLLAPSSTNIVYTNGDQSLEEIIEESRKPTIYVTSNWYTRFTNMLEGSFSTIPRDGMFLIEDGEIKKPVRKLRLADNLIRMSKNITAIGNDRRQIFWWEVYTPTFIPTIKVSDCKITAATQ